MMGPQGILRAIQHDMVLALTVGGIMAGIILVLAFLEHVLNEK